MNVFRRKDRARPPGLSLIEVSVASTVFLILEYALVGSLQMGKKSTDTVIRVAVENENLRKANHDLVKDLSVASDASITVETLADNNHRVTFMLPIEVGGNMTWGVWDPALGADPVSQTKENWNVRYTVVTVPDGSGGTTRRLMRQILDLGGLVQLEKPIADGLRSGNDDPPGFRVVKPGIMWQLSVSTIGEEASDKAKTATFDIWPRN